MKKIIVAAIAAVAAISFTSCASKKETPMYQETTTGTATYGYSK